MRITLKPAADTQLPLIEEIPEMRLARLEGNNGIGKTLTVRLLQICTGRSPYLEHPLAWKSFRERIGAVTVTVSGLEDVDEIEWKLRPAGFDENALAEPDDECFEIKIGNRRGTLAEARQLVGVERLAGDQGLAETFSQQVAADEAGVAARLLPLVAAEGSALASVQAILDDALETARRVDAKSLLSKKTAAERAKKRLDMERQKLRERTAREQALREAWELQMRLQERERVGEGLDRKLEELGGALNKLKDELNEVQTEIKDTEKLAARSDEAKRVIANARKREKRRSEEVQQLHEDLARLRVVADVPENTTASALRTKLQKEAADLQERYVAIDAVPLMRGVTDDLLQILRQAEVRGLGKQALVEGGATVSELRTRLEQRRESLRAVSPTSEGAALLARIKALGERIEAVDELLEVSEALAKSNRLVKRARDEIEEATKEADTKANERLEELRTRANELDTLIQETSSQRTVLLTMANEASTGETQQQMRSRLKHALKDLAVTSSALEKRLSDHALSVREAETEFAEAEDAERTANREAVALERDFDRSIALLSAEGQFSWLHGALRGGLLSSDVPLERRLVELGSLVDRLGSASQRANGLRGQVQAVHQALRGIKETLRHPQNGGPDSIYHEGLIHGYENEFKEVFADPWVSELLLGTGARVKDVSLRADQLSVEYQDAAGVSRHQPLEAFSRGQQAFAYTRARLATLDALANRPQHRLVVLDEFGAFIARDRLGELTKLLGERVKTTPGEQILLILPASTDYEALATLADDSRAKTLRGYAEELATQGFVFEELPIDGA